MTSIDSAGTLAAAIRRQVSSLSRPTGVGTGAVARSRNGSAGTATRSNAGAEAATDVAALVARRILAIDPNDPKKHRKAFRMFLESVLLAEFGTDLVNDAGFHRLVDDVHSQMESDDDLAAAIEQAAGRMLTASAGK
jgi:hypothetical protein